MGDSAGSDGVGKAEMAYQWLQVQIRDRRFEPGERLVLGRIADELGISVVPVREAIRRLEAQGLVVYERHVGARIVPSDLDRLAESFEAAVFFGSMAAALGAPHLGDDAIAEAREMNRQMARMAESGGSFEVGRFLDMSMAFHRILMAGCPNPVVREQIWSRRSVATLSDVIHHMDPAKVRNEIDEHDQILDMIVAGVGFVELEQFLRAHTASFWEQGLRQLANRRAESAVRPASVPVHEEIRTAGRRGPGPNR